MARLTAIVSVLIVAALAGVWAVFSFAPRWYGSQPAATIMEQPPTAATAAPERKIKATLYYVSEDGLGLVGTEREVPFADPIDAQARRIVEAQLSDPPAPLASAIPAGTTLRSLFMTERGEAFLDLSADVTTKHPGGALNELFTVYAVVNALTVNLPAIARVQILVNGKEVDTLAGHVDLRHPLQKNLKWIASPASPATPASPPEETR
jgi:spore germination protein GerM